MCTILNQRPLNGSKHSTLSLGGWFGAFFQLEFINKTLGLFVERQVFKPPVCQWPLEERWNKSLRYELGVCMEPFDLHRGVIKSETSAGVTLCTQSPRCSSGLLRAPLTFYSMAWL